MAVELGRSIKTVESHRNSLREKLGLKNNRQLLQLAARWTQFDGSE
jgi:DNA-binding CsgD family transcriptional regulator